MINVWSCTHFLIRIIWTVFELFFLDREPCISRPSRIYDTTVYYFWNWKGISDFYSLVWVKEKKFGSILKEKFSISGVPTTLQVKLDRQRNLTLKSRPLVWPQLWSDIGAKYLVSVPLVPSRRENLLLLTHCRPVPEFWKIKLKNTILTNWIFSLQKSISKLGSKN